MTCIRLHQEARDDFMFSQKCIFFIFAKLWTSAHVSEYGLLHDGESHRRLTHHYVLRLAKLIS